MARERKVQILTLVVIGGALAFVVARESGWRLGTGGSLLPTESATAAEPRETIYRMLDAAREGDAEAYLSCYSGQMERMLRQSRQEMTTPRFARYLAERNREIKGVAISEPVALSDTQVQIRVEYVYADRNEAQQFRMEKRSAGWKIAGVEGAERVETLVPYGTPVY